MRISVKIPVDCRDRMLASVSIGSSMHSLLTSGMILEKHRAGAMRVVEVFCRRSDARALLFVAKMLSFEAAKEIEESIELSRAYH
jgi:hypothetical protein